jgi:hypothetical protein
MPSKSKAQHRLMEAVAHNSGFAKKVGIPQSVGKHFHEADKMKRKKHYDDGGDVDVGDMDTAVDTSDAIKNKPDIDNAMSFSTAFKMAKANGDGTFTWRGKKYTTESAPAKPKAPVAPASKYTGADYSYANMQQKEKELNASRAAADAMGKYWESKMPAAQLQKTKEMRASQAAADAMGKYWSSKLHPAAGMKKGGHVKHADELKGKAKETKSIAHEEMKALKRGHAPKKILEHEKAEHKAMGYKKGGKIETPKKGFAMAESKGGRKPPHGKHASEGDYPLKGFGMGKGLGKGRTVTRAPKPKEEEKTKSFAMKKGGHVKHHAKGGAAKAPRKSKGSSNAAALASMLGAPGQGAGGPPGPMAAGPGGMPGMKHGGHVSHHHHHHYAKGGEVRPGIDEAAEHGHTRGKQVKMAKGGHVGSHPHRRADGIASKGHTSCKIR